MRLKTWYDSTALRMFFYIPSAYSFKRDLVVKMLIMTLDGVLLMYSLSHVEGNR